MALPTNVTPTYTLTIPSTKAEFKYRPFLVKDEKALLVAQQSEDQGVILDTIKELITVCAKSAVDVNALTYFDVEYIFLKLRSVSVGETAEMLFSCDVDHGEAAKPCKTAVQLDKVYVDVPEGHTNNIKLFDDVGIVLKYPSSVTISKMAAIQNDNFDLVIDIVIDCIDYIYNSNEIFKKDDHTHSELVEFIGNLKNEQFAQIEQFFATMPQTKIDVQYICPVCQLHHKKVIGGLNSFF